MKTTTCKPRTLARRLSRTSVWTSLGLACTMFALTPVSPLAWWAVAANLAAAAVAFAL
jgi:hypothetical protein